MAAAEVLDVIAALEYSLRSKSNPQEKITLEEESFLRNLKEKLLNSFVAGGVVSSVVCWTGTGRFGYGPRLLISAGAGFFGGTWACKWTLRSCLDPIIAADGSRMQKELANIMIAKQQAGQLRPSFISKHLYKLFYPERVFVDSPPDNLYTRWRLRNTYEDNLDGGTFQRLSIESSKGATRSMQISTESLKPTTQRLQKQEVKEELDSLIRDNPLDSICGSPGSDQEIEPRNNILRSRKVSHSHKRARRRQRARNHRAQDQSQAAD